MARRPRVLYIGPSSDPGKLRAWVIDDWDSSNGELEPWNADSQGSITHGLVQRLAESDAVVADVRTDNPNVYYEIGLAHAFDTPVIPLVEKGGRPAFDIQDQQAIEVETAESRVVNHEAVSARIAERLRSLATSPSRTSVSAYRESVGIGGNRWLPTDGWDYLARRGGLVNLAVENARAGEFVFHLAHGIGEIVEHGQTTRGTYEVRVVFKGGPATVVLPDERAYLAEPRPFAR